MLQCGLGVCMAEMGLDVLDVRELGHVGGASASQHLVRNTIDPSLSAGFLEDAEQEIVRIDRSPTA